MESWSISSSKNASADLRALSRKLKQRQIPGVLGPEFYARNTERVALELLGKLLVARAPSGKTGITAGRIVETEAYHGTDPASHSARGETPRSAIMFGAPGRAYVYFIYGVHEMLNFVTERKGYPGAVLIRAVEPVFGQELMSHRRPGLPEEQWTNGPGRLCKAMGILLEHNGENLSGPILQVVDDGFVPKRILVSPRIGIRVGTETPWRFFVGDNPFVSKSPFNTRAVEVLMESMEQYHHVER